ncbi:MAG: monovalent cation/H(+) antiporter subunit G [Bacillota bacterium]
MLKSAVVLFFLLAGAFFFAVGTLGLLRLPDTYTRMHATTKSDTLGIGLIFLALGIHVGFTYTTAKLLLIVVFIWLTNPTATHVVARAVYRSRKQTEGYKRVSTDA